MFLSIFIFRLQLLKINIHSSSLIIKVILYCSTLQMIQCYTAVASVSPLISLPFHSCFVISFEFYDFTFNFLFQLAFNAGVCGVNFRTYGCRVATSQLGLYTLFYKNGENFSEPQYFLFFLKTEPDVVLAYS